MSVLNFSPLCVNWLQQQGMYQLYRPSRFTHIKEIEPEEEKSFQLVMPSLNHFEIFTDKQNIHSKSYKPNQIKPNRIQPPYRKKCFGFLFIHLISASVSVGQATSFSL